MHECKEHDEELIALFHLDVTSDDPDVHPKLFCSSCYICCCQSTYTGYIERDYVDVTKSFILVASMNVEMCRDTSVSWSRILVFPRAL